MYSKVINVKQVQDNKRDSKLLHKYFLELESGPEMKIKDAKYNIEKLGFEIVSYSSENNKIVTAKIQRDKFKELETKIDRYANEKNNPNKTYLAAIEGIRDIKVENKITKDLEFKSNQEENIIVTLYNVLTEKEKKLF